MLHRIDPAIHGGHQVSFVASSCEANQLFVSQPVVSGRSFTSRLSTFASPTVDAGGASDVADGASSVAAESGQVPSDSGNVGAGVKDALKSVETVKKLAGTHEASQEAAPRDHYDTTDPNVIPRGYVPPPGLESVRKLARDTLQSVARAETAVQEAMGYASDVYAVSNGLARSGAAMRAAPGGLGFVRSHVFRGGGLVDGGGAGNPYSILELPGVRRALGGVPSGVNASAAL